jgi:hypothetical protein
MEHSPYDCVTKLQGTQPLFVSLTWKQQRQKEFQKTQSDHDKTCLILTWRVNYLTYIFLFIYLPTYFKWNTQITTNSLGKTKITNTSKSQKKIY